MRGHQDAAVEHDSIPEAAHLGHELRGEERAISAARTDRGRPPRAERIPRSSMKQRTRQAVSRSRYCQASVGTRPETTSSALRSRITAPISASFGTSSGRAAGKERHLQEAADPGLEVASRREPRGEPQEGEIERRVDVESGEGGGGEVADPEARGLETARRAVVAGAALERRQGELEVAGHHERIGAEAVVGDHLAGERGVRRSSRWPSLSSASEPAPA